MIWCTDAPLTNFPISQACSSPFQIIWMMESLNIEKKLAADLMAFLDPWARNLLARCLDYGMSDRQAATARKFTTPKTCLESGYKACVILCDCFDCFVFFLDRHLWHFLMSIADWWPLWLCEVCGFKVRKCNWLRHLGTKKHSNGVENGGGGGGTRSRTVPPYT